MTKRPRLELPTELTKAQLEVVTGYSSKQLTRWIQSSDIPHRREGNEVFFPWPAVRGWLHTYLEEKGRRAATGPVTKDAATQARAREDVARAELLEIDLAKARGELMKLTDFESRMADAFARVRARLANLAPRAAAAAFGADSVLDAQARIQPVIDEVFDELRQTDDVPTSDEESDAEDSDSD